MLFELHLASTLMMTGIIWFVQVVHYPLFALVGRDGFSAYAVTHSNRTGRVVAPLMLAELAGAVLLLPAGGLAPALAWVNLALLAAIWVSTFAVQVPLHRRLASGFDPRAAARLVAGNWIRTAGWTLRSLLLLSAIHVA